MTSETGHVALSGSEPVRLAGSVEVPEARPADDALLEIAVLVGSRRPAENLAAAVQAMSRQLPAERRYLDHGELEADYGADPGQLDRVRAFSSRAGLEVRSVDAALRLAVLRGTAAALRRAFRVEFTGVRHGGRLHRSIRGPLHLPVELRDVVEAVFGLDDVPRFDRTTSARDAPDAGMSPAGASPSAIDTERVEGIYGFPEAAREDGGTVAVIMLGGGYFAEDLDACFRRTGVRRTAVRHVDLGGATNDPVEKPLLRAYLEDMGFAPRDPSTPKVDWHSIGGLPDLVKRLWWTIEAALDVQLVGTLAGAANVVVYFAPPTEAGKIHALATALGDREHCPSVITCSWGSPEDRVSEAVLGSMDRLLQAAALLGVTVCYSSGDAGADVGPEHRPHVHFPASSPHALSCGGTILDLEEPDAESVWQETMMKRSLASGGGFSGRFPSQAWQAGALAEFGAGTGWRGVPDVAAKADMARGYGIFVGGHRIPMGGTSAAAPLWAALAARLHQALGRRVGWITPLLYRDDFRGALHRITRGSNGYFSARQGWDPCTGYGSPRGRDLLDALGGGALAR